MATFREQEVVQNFSYLRSFRKCNESSRQENKPLLSIRVAFTKKQLCLQSAHAHIILVAETEILRANYVYFQFLRKQISDVTATCIMSVTKLF